MAFSRRFSRHGGYAYHPVILSQPELESFVCATQSRPHDFLGMHPVRSQGKQGLVARAFLGDALKCELVPQGNDTPAQSTLPLARLHESGFFETFIHGTREGFPYQLRITRHNGDVCQIYDPYSFLPTLGELDLHLFNEGTHARIYEKLGSHPCVHDGVMGTAFAVWAPEARRVSVVGDFNNWDGRYHMMRTLGASGIWEIFIPGIRPGARYKYEILGPNGPVPFLKSDPYAVRF